MRCALTDVGRGVMSRIRFSDKKKVMEARERDRVHCKRGVWKEVDVKEVLGKDREGTDHGEVGRH